METKNLIVGAGLSGLVLAERLANIKKEQVLIIDKRDHIGGNIYDYEDKGILVHKYGTHIFHTNNENVWKYLNQFTRFYPYMHRVKAMVDGKLISVPFNLKSLQECFPKSICENLERELLGSYKYGERISILDMYSKTNLKFLCDFIYEKIFYHYTLKQWQCEPQDLDASVFQRVPVNISLDDRYFTDRFQGIPMQGYTTMCKKMLENDLITVRLNTTFNDIRDDVKFERLFFCGAIDEFFDYKYGYLPYRSLEFDFVCFEKEYFQENSVINYPNNYTYTRIGEYKYFLDQKTKHTIVSFEYPKTWESPNDERYYPIPNKKTEELYKKYLNDAKKLKNTYFIGRLGEYKYYDMDKVVANALALYESISR
ncbi:TPA: UDP-galactopyranose mutase [Campylobacter coli]|nr:UDP-galactopyranose mutase [Campylobacter coli]